MKLIEYRFSGLREVIRNEAAAVVTFVLGTVFGKLQNCKISEINLHSIIPLQPLQYRRWLWTSFSRLSLQLILSWDFGRREEGMEGLILNGKSVLGSIFLPIDYFESLFLFKYFAFDQNFNLPKFMPMKGISCIISWLTLPHDPGP